MIHETFNLCLDDDGTLYNRVPISWDPETGAVDETELKRLGHIEKVEYEADNLGFANEYAECLDQWNDSQYDYAGQVRDDYRRSKGF